MRPNESGRIYKKGSTPKKIITACLIVLAVILFFNVFAFFYLQRYVVETEDGVELVVPWLPENNQGSPGDRH